MKQHTAQLLSKLGSEWTNDLGETFPAAPLYRYECSCGWKGQAWYASEERAASHFDRHAFPLIEETSDPVELPTISSWLQAGGPMREL